MLRFLINPSSGGGRIRRHMPMLQARAVELAAGFEVSTSGSDLTARAARAVAEGVTRLIVAGGDGTMHLAVQSLAQTGCELGVVPSGRGDDFACSLGIPASFSEALELAISGQARPIDLGRGGDLWFTIYAGSGFDSATSQTADGQPRWWPNSITYIIAALRTLVSFKPPTVRLEFDEGVFEGRVMFVTACNAPRFGGGMQVAPEARMDDGLLDLVIVRAVSKPALLRVFPRVFRGTHVGHPAITIHRTRTLRLSMEPAQLLGCDGELVGEVGNDPLEVEVRPGSLQVVTLDAG